MVSHPSVVGINQEVYRPLHEQGWDVTIVTPNRWRHEFSKSDFAPVAVPGLDGRLQTLPVAFSGRPQRHFYFARPRRWLEWLCPDVVFLEEESFALAAAQWAFACVRAGIPFGVQAAENLERPLPIPVRALRKWTLQHAAFVAARSLTAAGLAEKWGATGDVRLVPHAVPEWERSPRRTDRARFTIGYAGRLVTEKGICDLLAAVELLEEPVELLLVGDGPLRHELTHAALENADVRVLHEFTHDRMPDAYAQMDVLVLPSRTTRLWREQFGRVLVEALWAGVPVIGSDSGEIPWVIEMTGGGRVFPEGDVYALAAALEELRTQPALRQELAVAGESAAQRLFSVEAAAEALNRLLLGVIDSRRKPQRSNTSSRRTTVALVAHEVHPDGGMERAFYELVRRGRDRFDFVILSNRLSPDLQPHVRWKRIRALPRPMPLKFILFYLSAGLKLAFVRPDVIHTMGALVPNRADIASVHFCHAGYAQSARRSRVDRPLARRFNSALARRLGLWAERWSFRPTRVAVLATVSEGLAVEVRRHYPAIPVTLTPNGVDTSRFQRDPSTRRLVRRSEKASESDVVALFVGNDWDHKGLAVTLEGVAQAVQRGGGRLCLWVVGTGDERRFRALCTELGIADRVRFLGFRRNVHRVYQAADIFVLPTVYESFSLAAFEAAASGLPLLVTRVHGVSDLIGEDGEAGFFVERSAESVRNGLLRLASSAELRRELGAEGIRRARGYSWERSVNPILDLYEETLRRRSELVRRAA